MTLEWTHARTDQVNLLARSENFAEILPPKNVTAVIATIAMNATRIPYSASAAPSSSLVNLLIATLMRATLTLRVNKVMMMLLLAAGSLAVESRGNDDL